MEGELHREIEAVKVLVLVLVLVGAKQSTPEVAIKGNKSIEQLKLELGIVPRFHPSETFPLPLKNKKGPHHLLYVQHQNRD